MENPGPRGRTIPRRRPAAPPRFRLLALLALLPLLGACAAVEEGPGPFGGGEDRLRVEVRSDGVATDNLVIYVVDQTGVRRRIGVLDSSGDGTFTFAPRALPEEYRLVAQSGARVYRTSNPFTITRAATVRWDLNGNTVTLRGG